MSDLREAAMHAVHILKEVDNRSGLTHSDAISCAETLQAALSANGGEAVATVERWNQGGSGELTTATGIEKLPHGTKLYTHPAPHAEGKVVPIGYLTNQAVARLQSDKRLNGEHLYAFKPDDLSKFQAVCLAPTVKESLTVAAPSVPENEIKAKGIQQAIEECNTIFRLHDGTKRSGCFTAELSRYAARLRTAGDEGEGSPTHNGGESDG